MSNDIALIWQQTPAQIVSQELSARLDSDWSYGPHTEQVKANARATLERLYPWSQPVSEEIVRVWVRPIVASVRNEKTGDQIAAWFEALMLTVGHLEVGGFNRATQREMLATCKFFPSAADVYEAVAGASCQIRRDMAGLKRVLAAPQEPAA